MNTCGCGCGQPCRDTYLLGHNLRLLSLDQIHGEKWHAAQKARTRPVAERFWNQVHKMPGDGCWLWISSLGGGGYGLFTIRRGEQMSTHRWSWIQANGQPPDDKPFVLHSCDVRSCVRPSHLFVGTQLDNVRDMYAKHRGNAVLTPEQVEQAVSFYASGLSQEKIGKILGTNQTVICRALKGRIEARKPGGNPAWKPGERQWQLAR